MQAVGADFDQEWVDEESGEPFTLVGKQRGAQDGEIGEQVGGSRVVRQTRGGCGNGEGGGEAEAGHDADDQQTETLELEALAEGCGEAAGAVRVAFELEQVTIDAGFNLQRDGYLLGRAAELVKEYLQALAIVAEEEYACGGERITGGLGVDEGIAVAIAADPGAEADQLRQGCE